MVITEPQANRDIIRQKTGRLKELERQAANISSIVGPVVMINPGILTLPPRNQNCKPKFHEFYQSWQNEVRPNFGESVGDT